MYGRRKVAVIGMGIWSCIGNTRLTVDRSLRSGQSGVGISDKRRMYGYQSPLTGIVPYPHLDDYGVPRNVQLRMSEQAGYAFMAVHDALQEVQLSPDELSTCGLIVSNDSSSEAYHDIEQTMEQYHDTRMLGSNMVFRTLNSSVSMILANYFHIGGLSLTVSAACAGGGHAIGIAMKLIQSGVLSRCIVVGAQEVGTQAYTSFDTLGIFSQRIDEPQKASRPFDAYRDGLVPSGGAAAVVLQASDCFSVRDGDDCNALGYIAGYGFTTSTSLASSESTSLLATMGKAISDAHIHERDIGLIMAHATGTYSGDDQEALAIRSFFKIIAHDVMEVGDRLPWIVATKAITGHECWMSGVSQVVYCLLQMIGHYIAPNPNFESNDLYDKETQATRLRWQTVRPIARAIPRTLHPCAVKYALCNSFGFGGTNACLVIENATDRL